MTEKPQLTLYNSLTRTKEVFTPQDPKRVTMYNCGPTVYSYAHIGNARAAVVADVLFRVLRHIYGEDHVIYARNITDVDDKIIQSAKEQGVDISVITEKYAKIYNEDLAAIGCLMPTHQPKATDSIQEMADIIVELLEKDIAYATAEGHVLFDVTRMADYGKLSGRKLEDNLGGARVDVAGYKRNAGDFLLWKIKADEESVGWSPNNLEAYINENWRKYSNQEIPLTPGRPGWHIECSAMIRDVLGDTIDIHCGGIDLKFPHHENEIAQSECANGKPLAKFWVHNEFLNMGDEKMSKSLGNVKLIHDLLKDWDGEVIRLALLKAHYRSELVWTEDLLKESKAQLDSAYRTLLETQDIPVDENLYAGEFADLIFDDLSVVSVGLILTTVRHFVQKSISNPRAHMPNKLTYTANVISQAKSEFVNGANLLGLLQKDPEDWFKGGASADEEAEFDAIANRREQARAKKDWPAADAARDEAAAKGIVLEDGPDGTTWRKA